MSSSSGVALAGGRRWLMVLAAVFAAGLGAGPAAAQTPPATPAGLRFLPRADFTFAWGHLFTTDKRFDWLGQMGVDFDVTDYRTGRLRFQALIEGGLGRERRRYDLNHGNYSFDAALSYRLSPAVELEAVIQHVSRHVVDRENPPAVSWNAGGARLRYTAPDRHLEGHVELVVATQPAFVDYTWITRARAAYRRPVSGRLSLFGTATGEVLGVDPDIRHKNRVCGGRVEGGLRVRGEAATLELFAGYERRLDAFPVDRFRVRWVTAGFRILNW